MLKYIQLYDKILMKEKYQRPKKSQGKMSTSMVNKFAANTRGIRGAQGTLRLIENREEFANMIADSFARTEKTQ